jgi:dTDP-glucose 4,6-dehydratase
LRVVEALTEISGCNLRMRAADAKTVSELSRKKVLVTGAGGFIGSHLAERLVMLGADVRAFLHYNSLGTKGWLDHSDSAGDIDCRFGDLADRDSVRAAIAGREIVFHLAALIGIPYSYVAPESYIRTNVSGTLNVLQAAREAGALVIQTSTSEVYGTAKFVPIDENHPLQGQSPYSASKIGADKLAQSFHLSFGLPVVTVRPFNTYGPRQSLRAIIPTIIMQALGSETVRLGNLGPTRDLNFVGDTVEGFIRAAATPAAIGGTFNLGTGQEISIGDLVGLIAKLLGQKVTPVLDDERVRPAGSEVERLVADASSARAVLGWEPAVTIEDGIARTIAWLQKNTPHYRAVSYVR